MLRTRQCSNVVYFDNITALTAFILAMRLVRLPSDSSGDLLTSTLSLTRMESSLTTRTGNYLDLNSTDLMKVNRSLQCHTSCLSSMLASEKLDRSFRQPCSPVAGHRLGKIDKPGSSQSRCLHIFEALCSLGDLFISLTEIPFPSILPFLVISHEWLI